MPEEVGVRELRQNLSKYLKQVKEGARLVVTERNRPVAVLGPPPDGEQDPLERLIAEGVVIPATQDSIDWEPIELPPGDVTMQEALDEVRADRDSDWD